MYLNSRRVTPQFRLDRPTSSGTSPRCPCSREPAGVLHSDAYCMTADSEHHDAAFSFVEYALGPEGAPVIARTGRTVPSLRSVAESDAFLDPDAAAGVVGGVPRHDPGDPRSCRRSRRGRRSRTSTDEILEAARADGTPAAEVARQLDEATRDLFARAE